MSSNEGGIKMIKNIVLIVCSLSIVLLAGCEEAAFNQASMDVRSTLGVTEIHWAGSIAEDGSANDPDDDFIEIMNYTDAQLEVGGWSICVSSKGSYKVYALPENIKVNAGDIFTVGRSCEGAFRNLDVVISDFCLPNEAFLLELKDGSGVTADAPDFALKTWLPAGTALPTMRKSAIRRIGFYGPDDEFQLYNWMTYAADVSSENVADNYRSTVLASPGEVIANEGFEKEEI
jgi:hypothetical protein